MLLLPFFCADSIKLVVAEYHTNYHNNYSVKDSNRIYYGGMLAYIQVAEH
ncbi:hypothetical protein CY34DRAFT_92425 [Suillus luteus UH-Slu-Lm8-n1]|uniref:CxC5 like cysteine cluster associated with KDZ domain-containing protein n=1 Tax=Suillus luteus UH-Slu-Lm8-n1 TaxID=930992 RepID=A0A0C9ZJK4_9AGAM|nr:hypothetical protein CY34DRAFT_92425 [Suillus luteus UH-Slu-Lm8-n1]